MPTIVLRSHCRKLSKATQCRPRRTAYMALRDQRLIARASRLSGAPSSRLHRRRNVSFTRNQQSNSRLISLGQIKGRNSLFVRGKQTFPIVFLLVGQLNCCWRHVVLLVLDTTRAVRSAHESRWIRSGNATFSSGRVMRERR